MSDATNDANKNRKTVLFGSNVVGGSIDVNSELTKRLKSQQSRSSTILTKCLQCEEMNINSAFVCKSCGMKLQERRKVPSLVMNKEDWISKANAMRDRNSKRFVPSMLSEETDEELTTSVTIAQTNIANEKKNEDTPVKNTPRPLPRTPSSDRNPLEDNISNEEQMVIKQVVELQDANGSWNLTDTLANLISIPNHIQISNSLSTDTEKKLVATTLVLSYLNYFHYVSENDIQFAQVIEKANHWVKETQRRSVALPSTLENSISATIIDSMFIDDQLSFKFHIVMVGNEWYITRSLLQIQEFRNSLIQNNINKNIELIQLPQDSYYDNDEEYYNKISTIDSFFKQILENKDILLNGATYLDSILAPKQIGDIDYEGVEITIQLVIDEKWSNISNQIKEILTTPLLSPNSIPNKQSNNTSNAANVSNTSNNTSPITNTSSPKTANTSNSNLSALQSPTPSSNKINRRKSFWDRVFFQSLTEDEVDQVEEQLITIDLTLQPSITIPLQDDRTRVAYEMYATEHSYTRSLEVIIKIFMDPLKSSTSPYYQVLTEEEIKTIFPVISELYSFHKLMLSEIESRIKEWSSTQLIGDLFLKYSPFFKMYSSYCKYYEKSNSTLMEVSKRKPVSAYLEHQVRLPSSNQPDLQSYLIQPVQRLPRVILLLTDLQKKTSKSHPDYDKITASLHAVKEIIDNVNESIRIAEKSYNFFQESVIASLMAPHRICIKKGTLNCINVSSIVIPLLSNTSREKDTRYSSSLLCTCFLFNDLFVITSSNKILHQFLLDTCWITIEANQFVILTPERITILTIEDKKEYVSWTTSIKDSIQSYNKKTNIRESTYTFSDGSFYKGQWEDAKMHGKGNLLFSNGNSYVGEFHHNNLEGNGKLTYPNGDIYEGAFKSNNYEGNGTLTLTNGSVYVGEWKSGSMHGNGKLYHRDSIGDFISGVWKQGVLNGNAELMCKSDGSNYKGEWKNNKRHGYGVLSTSNFIYEGNFENNTKQGKGKLREFTTGTIYEGDFNNDCKHGTGNLLTKSYQYSGTWANDLFDGKGILKNVNNGDIIYDGSFQQGLKHGIGTWRSPEGQYDGNFNLGLREGEGKMRYSNGDLYEGSWRNDRKEGKGKMTNYEGIYEGIFLADLKDGEGAMNYSDGRKYYGSFKRNMKHGQGILIIQGAKYDGKFKMDKKDGKGVYTDRTGKYVGYFRNDVPHGKGTFISIVDNSQYEGEWSEGLRHGRGVLKQFNGPTIEQLYKYNILQESSISQDTTGPLIPSISSFLI